MGLFDILQSVINIVTVIRAARTLPNLLRQSDKYWEIRNTIADVQLKARGHIAPVIIERLDDGTHPEYQHLSIDVAPDFPQERIEKALHYWPGQSIENVVNAMWAAVVQQALRGAEVGEERTTTLILDVFDGYRYATTIHGVVGGEWERVAERKHLDLRKMWASAQAKGNLQNQMRREARATRKAAKRSAN